MSKEKKAEKEQSPSFFKELGVFMKPYMPKYVLSVILSILSVGSRLLSYAAVGMAAAKLFEGGTDFREVLTFMAAAVIFKICNAVLLNVSTWISHRAAYPTLRDIRMALSEKMMRLPLGYFETNGSGRLKTMLVDRIETMEQTLAHMLPELTASLLGPLLLMIWMFVIDWRLALISLIWTMLGFMAAGGMMRGYEEKYAGQIRANKSMNQAVVEFVRGIEVIKNFGRVDECYAKYQNAVYGHAEYNVNWVKETQIYTSLSMAISPFSLFPVLIGGLIFYGNGTMEAGTLFLMILLNMGIFGPIMQASGYFDQLAQMGTHAKEVRDILDYPELVRGTKEEVRDAGIRMDHVTFHYDGSEEAAVTDVSFQVPAGTMLALVGPSGSGKSTIGKLLAGYWDPSEGEILLGGVRMSELSQEAINANIAYVDQETFLFDQSILENIRMGNPKASDEEVIKAAERAGCDEFIRALPDGYRTEAGQAGGRLSGGERQRIAIARAMMKNAPVMILDEATSGSDPENEASIQKALSAAAKGKTLVVVAHHLATVMHAQQIAFVRDGKIQMTGTHGELLRDCPEYREMWELSEEVKS